MRREDLLLAATSVNPGLDRAAHLRIDLAALAAYPSKTLDVARGGVRTQGEILYFSEASPSLDAVIFLGLDSDGVAYFAQSGEGDFTSLREAVSQFPAFERLIAAHAVALMNWH